jgi:hypothetical protein
MEHVGTVCAHLETSALVEQMLEDRLVELLDYEGGWLWAYRDALTRGYSEKLGVRLTDEGKKHVASHRCD